MLNLYRHHTVIFIEVARGVLLFKHDKRFNLDPEVRYISKNPTIPPRQQLSSGQELENTTRKRVFSSLLRSFRPRDLNLVAVGTASAIGTI